MSALICQRFYDFFHQVLLLQNILTIYIKPVSWTNIAHVPFWKTWVTKANKPIKQISQQLQLDLTKHNAQYEPLVC